MNTHATHTTRQLTRSTSDSKLAGVAGGLGEYFSVDPIIFRVGFAVSLLFSGAGAIAYLVLLMLMPRDADAPMGATPAAA
jgi:phage shock protein C